jgi:hypothetical protein
MQPRIFDLRDLDMASAYDWSQSAQIKHGDVMLVADGVAVMCEAWPVMVAGASDVFHRVADGVTWERFALDCPRPGMAERLLAGIYAAKRPLAALVAYAIPHDQLVQAHLAALDAPEPETEPEPVDLVADRLAAALGDMSEPELAAIRSALVAVAADRRAAELARGAA